MANERRDDDDASIALVAAIDLYFAATHWMPLLIPMRLSLQELPQADLESLVLQVNGAGERLVAVAAIVTAITKHHGEDPPDDGDLKDSAILNLR
jgi:hypothetical protein